jgi:hypothetical protein
MPAPTIIGVFVGKGAWASFGPHLILEASEEAGNSKRSDF